MAGHSKWASIRHLLEAQHGKSRKQLERERQITDRAEEEGESVRFEGYGPGGTALLIDCRTDNRERTVTQLRQVLARFGGHLGAYGSVGYLFHEVGLLLYPAGTREERLMKAALHAGAEDVVPNSDGSIEVLADPVEFETVRALLKDAGFVPVSAEITQRASTSVQLIAAAAASMVHLLESLENLNDIQNVYTNAEIPDEFLAHL